MRKPSKASWNRYFTALGAFYHAYMDMEHHLTCAIINVVSPEPGVGRSFRIAKAVTGGQRMSPLKDTIKRLLRVVGAPKDVTARVDQVFSHLGDIQFFRDRLAHHMTLADASDVWVNDDFAAVRELDKRESIEFHTSAIVAATSDLRAMKWYLDPLFVGFRGAKEEVHRKPFDATLPLPAWQYKPSMLTRHRQK